MISMSEQIGGTHRRHRRTTGSTATIAGGRPKASFSGLARRELSACQPTPTPAVWGRRQPAWPPCSR